MHDRLEHFAVNPTSIPSKWPRDCGSSHAVGFNLFNLSDLPSTNGRAADKVIRNAMAPDRQIASSQGNAANSSGPGPHHSEQTPWTDGGNRRAGTGGCYDLVPLQRACIKQQLVRLASPSVAAFDTTQSPTASPLAIRYPLPDQSTV
jgi:hypothetical protein